MGFTILTRARCNFGVLPSLNGIRLDGFFILDLFGQLKYDCPQMIRNVLFSLVFLLTSNLAFSQWFADPGYSPDSLAQLKPGENSLSVFWWNVRSADLNSYYFKKYKKNVLDENLIEIASLENAPDVLILGEFFEPHHGPGTYARLKEHYPFAEEFPYNAEGSPLSILVLSKFPFTYHYEVNAIDWAPIDSSVRDREKYKQDWVNHYQFQKANTQFTRSFQSVRVKKNGQFYSIAPTHISQPWAIMGRVDGKLLTVSALLEGTQNPYYNSVLHYRRVLEKYEDSISTQEPFLAIGDFNIPSTLFKVAPVGFKELGSNLVDVPIHGPYKTFPARSAPVDTVMPAMNLDHGLTRQNVNTDEAVSPRLMGSDHYPLWLVISSKN